MIIIKMTKFCTYILNFSGILLLLNNNTDAECMKKSIETIASNNINISDIPPTVIVLYERIQNTNINTASDELQKLHNTTGFDIKHPILGQSGYAIGNISNSDSFVRHSKILNLNKDYLVAWDVPKKLPFDMLKFYYISKIYSPEISEQIINFQYQKLIDSDVAKKHLENRFQLVNKQNCVLHNQLNYAEKESKDKDNIINEKNQEINLLQQENQKLKSLDVNNEHLQTINNNSILKAHYEQNKTKAKTDPFELYKKLDHSLNNNNHNHNTKVRNFDNEDINL